MAYSYTCLNKMFTYSYTVLLYTHFAVCKQSLQKYITVLVSEFSTRDVKKWDHSYTNGEELGQSYTFSQKRGLIVYLAALKKGAIRAANPHYVGFELAIDPPPPPGGILYTMIF